MVKKPTYEELEQRVNDLSNKLEEREQIEKALRASEERFRLLYERAPLGYQSLDANGNFVEVNQAWLDTLGYTREEVIGSNFGDFLCPDWVDHFKENFPRFKAVGEILGVEFKMVRKDGSQMMVSFNGKIGLDEQGAFKQTHCILSDITEQVRAKDSLQDAYNIVEQQVEQRTAELVKANDLLHQEINERIRAEEALRESEEKYRNVVENSNDGICIIQNTIVKFVNAQSGKMIGANKEELLNKRFFNYVHADELPKLMKSHERFISGEETKQRYETVLVDKNGSYLNVEFNISETFFDNKKAALVMIRDITDTKRLQAQLQETQKMEAIATLAGGIAHQFNNALSSITGHTGLLEMNYSQDEKITWHTEAMKQSAHRMAHLTDQLLAYARGGKYNPKILSLNSSVKDTIALLQHTLDPAVRVETDLPLDVMNVKADSTQIEMVISAIMANSNEAIEGPGRIRISTRNMDLDREFIKDHPGLKPGSYVCLSIEDDGKGMDEETRERIFDPFFTTHFMGRGLGMASVYGIIKNHDGAITVDSEPGKGTAVRIYLPAIEAKEEVKEEVVLRPTVELAMGEGTILVIEDEEVLVGIFRDILEKLGYRVLETRTGKQAVELAKTFDGQIALALLDIKLPDMEGGKIYPLIMEARPDLKVIVCSGYSIDGPAQDILDAGAEGFIQKPFSISTFAEKLKEVLEGK